jgi:hypothetical protein
MVVCIISEPLVAMREPQLPVGTQTSTAPARGERDPWLGLGLILLSAVGVVTVVAATVYLGWRAGLAGFGALVVVLALFLRWEMRRRTSRRAAAAGRGRAAVTEPNSP